MSKANDIRELVFQPGQALFEENEVSYHFFVIQSGQVEIFKSTPDGRKIPLAVVSEGISIGEFAMIDRKPRSATARALTEVRAALIPEDNYKQLLTELPDWAVAVMKGLVDRVRQTNGIIHRAEIVDRQIAREIQSLEFDSEGIHLTTEGDDDDNPDLA